MIVNNSKLSALEMNLKNSSKFLISQLTFSIYRSTYHDDFKGDEAERITKLYI